MKEDVNGRMGMTHHKDDLRDKRRGYAAVTVVSSLSESR